MELGQRKKDILGAVINSYIKTGEPVGSKHVMDALDMAVSSATIRNDMAVLEEQKLLYQPHTSAGRVPSPLGYKLYIEQVMKEYVLDDSEKEVIDNFIIEIGCNINEIAKKSINIISELTACAAVAVTPTSGGTIQMFEAVIAGKHLIALLAISDLGQTKTKVIVTDAVPDSDSTLLLGKLLNLAFGGMSPDDIHEDKIAWLENEILEKCPDFYQLMPFFVEFINELKGYDVVVSGAEKILSQPEFSDINKAKSFLSLLTKHSEIADTATKSEGIKVDVFPEHIADMSMISSGVLIGKSNSILCVFGPTRMDYAKVMAKLNYLSKGVSDFIKEKYLD